MIPQNTIRNIEIKEASDLTWAIDFEKNVVGSKVEGREAVTQAIYMILNTERYRHAIYSWNYGVEFADLMGQTHDYVYPEVKRRITEALMVDNRITDVNNFEFSKRRGAVYVTFTVSTVYGDVEASKEVSV